MVRRAGWSLVRVMGQGVEEIRVVGVVRLTKVVEGLWGFLG